MRNKGEAYDKQKEKHMINKREIYENQKKNIWETKERQI